MSPPERSSQRLSEHLTRSRTAAISTLIGFAAIFAGTWIALTTWVLVANPERLGPTCLLIALALMVLTTVGITAAGCAWWFAATWQKWLVYVAKEVAHVLLQATAGGDVKVPARNGAAVHALTPTPRR